MCQGYFERVTGDANISNTNPTTVAIFRPQSCCSRVLEAIQRIYLTVSISPFPENRAMLKRPRFRRFTASRWTRKRFNGARKFIKSFEGYWLEEFMHFRGLLTSARSRGIRAEHLCEIIHFIFKLPLCIIQCKEKINVGISRLSLKVCAAFIEIGRGVYPWPLVSITFKCELSPGGFTRIYIYIPVQST